MQKFIIDLNAPTTPFVHYWEECVGSGHAALALREDWRLHLKKCHDELGFKRVRFHGLLNDDMSVYIKDREGKVHYCFFNIDSIFDYLLKIGMKPFIELSFMPEDMASGSKTVFHYKGNITPPKDYNEWGELIYRLTEHLVKRYGIEEVRKWFFEVWNEPNLQWFWSGTQDEYFMLYRHAAEAIKKVDEKIPVGGPATAKDDWIPDLINFCSKNDVPLDFISTHHYPTDVALGHYYDMEEAMARSKRGILKELAAKSRIEAGRFPLYYTEWNNSPSSRDPYHDDPYAAAFVVKTIADNQGLVDMYSFWTFSDIFEEAGFSAVPFHGGFGLLNIHGIPKPTFRAFELLHKTGNERLNVLTDKESTVEVLAVKKADVLSDEIMILIYNHNIPLAPIKEENVSICIKGIKSDIKASIQRIDDDNANAKKYWLEMGSPEYLDKEMVDYLLKKSEMVHRDIDYMCVDENIVFDISVPPHGIAAITLKL
ncbi:GH39 family glycosyl hydrolase [Caldanaerobius polysaccharolyticus]|uniref:GH39 family glycosyl hydrolase n=1 Tax=Caldanaerobius polysaccharolyticus TaxID=44256 RepID=UPI00047D8C7E|nr:beta-xylosidase [Caldanaerobius polysaccharolyticus]